MELDGMQQGQLNTALRAAFGPDDFDDLLLHRLDKRTEDLARMSRTYPTVVGDVIDKANKKGWIDQLIVKAREAVPGNARLWEFAQQFGLASTTTPRQELERVISEANRFLDINVWRGQLGEIEPRVCRIEFEMENGKVIQGTGFLFGSPDTVLTNYHVMEAVYAGENNTVTLGGHRAKAESVVCRFDLKRLYDPATQTYGRAVNEGTTYKLAPDWDLEKSPNSPLDALPPPDHLDYALIRLEGSPGNDTVGDKASAVGTKRGYIPLPEGSYDFPADAPLCIVQHPRGLPLQLAIDTKSILKLNKNGTRVTYRTNTEPGSSGSPCFTLKWELVALHHSGDPDFDPAHKPTYNEGIPMSAIVKHLRDKGVDKNLGAEDS